MKVVLTLHFLVLFSPVPAHFEAEYLYRGSKKSVKTPLTVVMGNGLRSTDPEWSPKPSCRSEGVRHTASATRCSSTDGHAALTRAFLAFSILPPLLAVSQCLLV